jgi:predicted Zn finger-like uncharacterized protein
MILTCAQCSAQLKLDPAHLPNSAFNVQCPKCQRVITVQPPAPPPAAPHGHSATIPPAAPPRPASFTGLLPNIETMYSDGEVWNSVGASSYNAAPAIASVPPSDSTVTDLVQMLTAAFSQATAAQTQAIIRAQPGSLRYMVMICASNDHQREAIRRELNPQDYDVIAAHTSEEALQLLQVGKQLDIVILEPLFDEAHQGSTAVLRCIGSFSPERRRRLLLAFSSPNCKTLDMATAFNQGANLLVNQNDLHELSIAIKKTISEMNYLYRAFNQAAGLNPM